MYDSARRDIIEIEKERKTKIEDLRALGGVYKEQNEIDQKQEGDNDGKNIYGDEKNAQQLFMSERGTTSTQSRMQQHQSYMDNSSTKDRNISMSNETFDPFSNNPTTTAKTAFL